MATIHVVTQITESLEGEPSVETWAFTDEDKAKDTAHVLRHANERDWQDYLKCRTRDAPPERIVRLNTVEVA